MDFPIWPVTKPQDSRFYRETPEDPAIRSDTESGWQIARARHDRRPRRTYTTGWTSLTRFDKEAVDQFVDRVRVGSDAFIWTHPVSGESILVRLKTFPGWTYDRWGVDGHRWDLHGVQFEEV